jgi:hypothetical protein
MTFCALVPQYNVTDRVSAWHASRLRTLRVLHDSANALRILRLRQSGFLHLAGISLTKANIRIFYLILVIIEFASDIASEPRADHFGRGTTLMRVIKIFYSR